MATSRNVGCFLRLTEKRFLANVVIFTLQVTIKVEGHFHLYTFYFNKWLTKYEWVTSYGETAKIKTEKINNCCIDKSTNKHHHLKELLDSFHLKDFKHRLKSLKPRYTLQYR